MWKRGFSILLSRYVCERERERGGERAAEREREREREREEREREREADREKQTQRGRKGRKRFHLEDVSRRIRMKYVKLKRAMK